MADTSQKVMIVLQADKEVPREVAKSLAAVVDLVKEDPAKAALVARELRAVKNITSEASDEEVLSALSATSDYEALAKTLHEAAPRVVELSYESSQEDEISKEKREFYRNSIATAEARGVAVKSEILNRQGPPLTSSDVAKRLSVTRSALLERRKKGTIIALHAGRHGFLYPRWQFGEGQYGLVPGLVNVLRALKGRDPWAKSIFLLKKHPAVKWRAPLDLLREGNSEQVLNLAKGTARDAR